MNTSNIVPVGTKVRVTHDTRDVFEHGKKVAEKDGPWKGLTGTVRNYTALGSENIHIVDFDSPTPESGDYGSIHPDNLEVV